MDLHRHHNGKPLLISKLEKPRQIPRHATVDPLDASLPMLLPFIYIHIAFDPFPYSMECIPSSLAVVWLLQDSILRNRDCTLVALWLSRY